MKKVLVVCLGNICRSPIAEAVLQDLADKAGLHWDVESAGTNGFHVGEPPHQSSQKICNEHGLDISKQRARRFVVADFDRYDLILVLASDVKEEVLKLGRQVEDSKKIHFFMDAFFPGQEVSVPDPWYGGEEGYAPVFDMIFRGGEAIIKKFG